MFIPHLSRGRLVIALGQPVSSNIGACFDWLAFNHDGDAALKGIVGEEAILSHIEIGTGHEPCAAPLLAN